MPAKRARSASPVSTTPSKKKEAKVVGSVDPDLPMTPEGVIYHLGCKRQDVADKFIFVGDPGRVKVVAERFDKGSLRFESSHREINIMTGKYKGVPVTCLSTGMGTDNVEIVINEIHALKGTMHRSIQWTSDKAVAHSRCTLSAWEPAAALDQMWRSARWRSRPMPLEWTTPRSTIKHRL